MPLPQRFWQMDVTALRAECVTREIDPEGLTRDDMREAIRGSEKEAGERTEIQKLKLEMGERERDKEREFEERQRDKQREFELKLRDLELERARTVRTESPRDMVQGPRVPMYREGEDIEIYLITFERLAEANGWPREAWAARLAAVLTGKARQAYVRMAAGESRDYDLVKGAILRRFDRDSEYYRTKFRDSRRESDESFKEWGLRIQGYFEQWVREAGNDMDKLKELLVLEQLMSNTSPDLQVWLKQRQPATIQQFAEMADVYKSSKRGACQGKTFAQGFQQTARVDRPRDRWGEDRVSEERRPIRVEPKSWERSRFVTCFKCGQKGHYKSDCPSRVNSESPKGGSKETSFWVTQQLHQDDLLHKPGLGSLAMSDRSVAMSDKLRLKRPCLINGRKASMVLDTGGSFSLVHRRYVCESSYTGESVTLFGIGTGNPDRSILYSLGCMMRDQTWYCPMAIWKGCLM